MRSFLVRCFLLIAMSWIACSGDYAIELPNGYELVRFNGLETGIVAPGGRLVINPTVREYAVLGDLVVGNADVPERLEGQPAPFRTAAGYFVLNTDSGEIADGLTDEAWRAKLAELGIGDEPKLNRPTPFD